VGTSARNTVGIGLLVALAYLATAFLVGAGLHQQIMPFWAPAGVALASVLRFGPAVLPGVFLGNLAFNLLIPLTWSDALQGMHIVTAILIASGAGIQAAVAAWLLHHYQVHPLTAGNSRKLVAYCLLAGPLSCLINASIGTAAVSFSSNAGGSAGILMDWLGWWVGDSFGAVVVTPLVLVLLPQEEAPHLGKARRRGLILKLSGILGVVILMNGFLMQRLSAQLEHDFIRDTRLLEAQFVSTIQKNFADLFLLGQRFSANGGMTPAQFREQVLRLQRDNPSVLAYSWDPLVRRDQRQAFEAQTRALLGEPDYAVDGVSLDPADPLMPVQLVEPLERNRAALGFNLLAVEDRRNWVLLAQQLGQPVATQILHLAQAPDEPGFLILYPVYRLDPQQQLLTGQRQLIGLMVGVFTVEKLLGAALERSGVHHVELSVREPGRQQPFFTTPDLARASERIHGDFELPVGQQVWQVETRPGADYMATHPANKAFDIQLLLAASAALAVLLVLSMNERERSLLSEVRRQNASLTHQALHDALTGLPNRAHLLESISRRLGAKNEVPFALLFIDLDRFKLINDSLGHHIGDRFLQEISATLSLHQPEHSELFRMGGDEFILLVEGGEQQACVEADRMLIACTLPMQIEEYQLQVTASIGISLYPQHGDDLDTLIKHADTAMYRAKTRGKNRYALYTEELTDQAVMSFSLEQELRQALAQEQLLLYYQPQFDLETGKLVGVEALVRWQHPERGMMAPGQFIPLAEETQLIIPLGWQVIELACRQMSQWDRAAVEIPCVAINVSPQQLLQVDFVGRLNQLVDKHQVTRQKIELEITEVMIMQDPDLAMLQLHKLREAGYRIALDDFGTGYSSLDRLKLLPLDRLKIDQAFTRDIGRDPKDEAIILTIIALGRSLGIEVLAEGVETELQRRFLQSHECDSVQGYLLGRPVAPQQLLL